MQRAAAADAERLGALSGLHLERQVALQLPAARKRERGALEQAVQWLERSAEGLRRTGLHTCTQRRERAFQPPWRTGPGDP